MLIDKIPIVDIIDGGWCNVQWAGNIWGVVFVRVLPFLFISIPGSLIACAAIIPSVIMAIKAQRKHRESFSQTETNPTMTSRSREVSSDAIVRPTSPTSPVTESLPSDLPSTSQSSNKIPNEAITRMALYCILYTLLGIPYSIYSLVKYFKYWNKPIDLNEITFCNYLSVGIGMTTLTIIFFIFATNGSSIKQYKEAYVWWKFSCFSPVYDFITGRNNDSIHVNIVRNVGSNSEKEPRDSVSISIRTFITEGNTNLPNEMQEELPSTVSSKNSITSKTKKRWSIIAASRESLIEAEKVKKVSNENTVSSVKDENSSLFNQKPNRNNLSMSSSSTYSSTTATAITAITAIDSSEPLPQQNNVISTSAPTSPISTSRPNSMRISDRYNSPRRFTSPLRRPSSPIVSSSSTSYNSQETRTTNTTYEDMREFEDDEIEPFPSLLKIGKPFNDEKGIWRPASTSSFSTRSRMSAYHANNIWNRPNIETMNRLSSSPTSPTASGNLFRNNLSIVNNDINGSSSNGNEKNK
ncbi:19303_t:CDS:2 [Rhizophagus irregularis]|nr:19303_t:CDS:2 [Rhizophagus irregularis]